MDKPKLIPVLFLVIIAALGFVAYRFYSENQILTKQNVILAKENRTLTERTTQLRNRTGALESEKKNLEKRKYNLEKELSRLERERDIWRRKYEGIYGERNTWAKESRIMSPAPFAEGLGDTSSASAISDEYWADFVKAKAELEARVSTLNKELMETKSKITEAERENKEWSIKIDEIIKQRGRLKRELRFKERTITIMSRDLVSEREARRDVFKEIKKFQADNVSLKRELILANKEKFRLHKTLRDAVVKKESLEDKMSEVRNILKEKSLALEELQEQLADTFDESVIIPREFAPVELPPIVVKPDAVGARGLRGEIIAVNYEEKFIIIDVGEVSGVTPGLKLKVVRGNKEIAIVEVIETRKEISAADIKEVLGSETIQEGDSVVSK